MTVKTSGARSIELEPRIILVPLRPVCHILIRNCPESSRIGVPGGGLAYRSKSCTANQQPSAVKKSDVIAAYSAAMLGQKVARAQPPPGTPIILDSGLD